MKIISWNCNGAFRLKYQALMSLKADIWVIQESESPEYLAEKGIFIPAEKHLWHGDRSCKGLSIFAFNGCQIKKADFFTPEFKYVLPVRVALQPGKSFLLTGIWASTVKNNHDWDYIGQMCVFMERYQQHFNQNSVMIGDFNSNMLWNSYYKKEHNYARFLSLLAAKGMFSVYHMLSGREQGQELVPTSYYHRDEARGFHIDYAFINKKKLEKLRKFEIAGKEWLQYSDHVPLVLELENE